MNRAPLALRVLGGVDNPRIVVSYRKTDLAYAHADSSVQPELPAYFSAFAFPRQIQEHVEATGSTRDYLGAVGLPYLHFDLDRPDLDLALRDVRHLSAFVADRYGVDPLVHFSGGKGFHVSLPTGGFVEPSSGVHKVAKALACHLAEEAHVVIDTGVYDRVRLWRATNSRHHKSGLHKVRIDLDDLLYLTPSQVRDLAREPIPYDLPEPVTPARLVEDWDQTTRTVEAEVQARRESAPRAGEARLNLLTRSLITDPTSIEVGERHRTLFSAAANLAEFQSVEELVSAMLTEPALDTGLPPRDVERQIRCGIDHARRHAGEGGVA